MEEKMERYFRLLLAFAVGMLICGAISLLMGCRTTSAVQATQTIRSTQTVRRDTVLWRDTVWVKDSVAVWMQGDTVYRERWRTKHADRYVYKVLRDTMIKTDTVKVSYPVVRTLTRWEKTKDKYFLPAVCVCGVLFVTLLWLIKRKV